MKYIINSASTWCADNFLDKYSDILSESGFKIRVLSENNKDKSAVIITIKSLNDLKKLTSVVDKIIVYDRDLTYPEYPRITIYDDFME